MPSSAVSTGGGSGIGSVPISLDSYVGFGTTGSGSGSGTGTLVDACRGIEAVEDIAETLSALLWMRDALMLSSSLPESE